jgi:hypothetical protein
MLQQLVRRVGLPHMLHVLSHVDVVHGLRQRRRHAQIGVDTRAHWSRTTRFKY